jgi:hypothetical protein
MSTVEQKAESKRGGQARVGQIVPLTMAAGATTDVTFTLPVGSRFVGFSWSTPAAFSGSPTNIYLTVGTSSGDQSYVANTDVKAKTAKTVCTLVGAGAADLDSAPSQTWHATLTANGGTSPAGTCNLLVEYTCPPGWA